MAYFIEQNIGIDPMASALEVRRSSTELILLFDIQHVNEPYYE